MAGGAPTRRPELDGVRGIAIALVLVAHTLYPTSLFTGGGIIGVQLFFVLSGFLITSILAGERRTTGSINLRGFYGRRARRLVPALGAFLVVFTAWTLLTAHPRAPQILLSATYISNWARVGGVQMLELNHTWSLAVEEQFYLAWPLAIIALLAITRRPGLVVLFGAIALMAWRVALTIQGADWARIYYATDTTAAALLAGAALAIAGVPTTRWARVIGAVSMAILVALSFTMRGNDPTTELGLVVVAFPLATLAGVGLVVAAVNERSGWLGARPLVFLGAISYGLYLWHTGLNRVAELDYGWDVTARLVLVPISIAIAWASLRWIEAPFRRRRSHKPLELQDRAGLEDRGVASGSHDLRELDVVRGGAADIP